MLNKNKCLFKHNLNRRVHLFCNSLRKLKSYSSMYLKKMQTNITTDKTEFSNLDNKGKTILYLTKANYSMADENYKNLALFHELQNLTTLKDIIEFVTENFDNFHYVFRKTQEAIEKAVPIKQGFITKPLDTIEATSKYIRTKSYNPYL